MKKGYILILCIITFNCLNVWADDTKFEFAGLEFDIDGNLRARTAYLNEFYPEDKYLMADARGQLSLEVSNERPYYFNSLLEIGNISFDDDTFIDDLSDLELEVKELYFGYDSKFFDGKIGIIDIKTPGEYVYDGEAAGVQVKFNFDNFKLKSFYSMTNLLSDELEVVENQEDLNHLIYVGIEKQTSYEYDLWAMYLDDNSHEDLDYIAIWLGWEGKTDSDFIDSEFGATLNIGKVTECEYDLPLVALYAHGMVELEASNTFSIFSRLNMTGSIESMIDTVNQFQVVDGEGSLDTGLSLMFGGSPYSSVSYFSDDSLSLYNENLSTGDVVTNDPGLIVYEAGITFDPDNIPLESQFVIGGANITNADEDDSSFLGFEFDLHNKYKINDSLSVALSLAYFIPGDAITSEYYSNEKVVLDDDNTFKMDCSFTYKF